MYVWTGACAHTHAHAHTHKMAIESNNGRTASPHANKLMSNTYMARVHTHTHTHTLTRTQAHTHARAHSYSALVSPRAHAPPLHTRTQAGAEGVYSCQVQDLPHFSAPSEHLERCVWALAETGRLPEVRAQAAHTSRCVLRQLMVYARFMCVCMCVCVCAPYTMGVS